MDKNKINSTINIFSFLSLSIVVFGVFSLGFFVAPITFHELNPRALAAEIMSHIFLRFYSFAFICVSISLVAEIIRFLVLKEEVKNKLWYLQAISVIVVVILTAYNNFDIAPKINNMRLENKNPTLWTNSEFVNLHKLSEDTAKIIFTIGLIPLSLMVIKRKTKNN